MDGLPFVWTGEHFYVREFTENMKKVSRFSYQHAFVESYNFTGSCKNSFSAFDGNHFNQLDEKNFILAQEVVGGKVIARNSTYPLYTVALLEEIELGEYILTDEEPLLQMQMIAEGLKIFPDTEWEANHWGCISRLAYKKAEKAENQNSKVQVSTKRASIENRKYKNEKDENAKNKKVNNGGNLKGVEYKLYDFKVSHTGFIKLCCTAQEPSHAFLVFEEIDVNTDSTLAADIRLARNNCLNIVEYQMAAGEFFHSSFEPYTARFVKIVVKSGKISDVNVSIYTFVPLLLICGWAADC